MVQWITHFENAQWKVEHNGFQFPDIAINAFFYRWEKSFVRVTWKVAGEIFCYINGEKYNLYNQNEQVVLELTDIVRAVTGDFVIINDYDNEPITFIEWVAKSGERPTSDKITNLPNEIIVATALKSVLPFYLQTTKRMEVTDNGSEWFQFPTSMSGTPGEIAVESIESYTGITANTLRIADTHNFEIYETSGAYGFGVRTVELKKGETYKFSANGNRAGADVGYNIMFFVDIPSVERILRLFINSNTDVTVSGYFVAPVTGTYGIGSAYSPKGAPAGTVTANWYKIELISGAQTRLIDLPCTNEHILFEWTGRFGVKKSWWFKKESVISEATKTINLQTLDSGFNTLKDKNTNLVISHRNADNLTQHYLSDIVLSDEVFCYPDETVEGKLQVRVETNSFEVGLNNRDIVLTINKNAYDTI